MFPSACKREDRFSVPTNIANVIYPARGAREIQRREQTIWVFAACALKEIRNRLNKKLRSCLKKLALISKCGKHLWAIPGYAVRVAAQTQENK